MAFALLVLTCCGSDGYAATGLAGESTLRTAQQADSLDRSGNGLLRPSGTELIPNGTFDTDIDGWKAYGGFPGPTVARDTTVSRSGRASMRVESPNAFLDEGAYAGTLRVARNTPYVLDVWLRAPTGTRFRVGLDWKDASFRFIGSSFEERTAGTQEWFRIRVLRTPPRKARYATVVVREREPPDGALVFYVDDISLQPLVEAPPALSSTSDFAITPLVNTRVRQYIESKSDLDRSSLLGLIIVPLVLVILLARELLTVGGRAGTRTLLAYGLPLIACFAILVFVRLRAYIG